MPAIRMSTNFIGFDVDVEWVGTSLVHGRSMRLMSRCEPIHIQQHGHEQSRSRREEPRCSWGGAGCTNGGTGSVGLPAKWCSAERQCRPSAAMPSPLVFPLGMTEHPQSIATPNQATRRNQMHPSHKRAKPNVASRTPQKQHPQQVSAHKIASGDPHQQHRDDNQKGGHAATTHEASL